MNESEYGEFIRKEKARAAAEGTTFSQKYLRTSERQFRKMEKKIPYLWKSIMGRKYLIPQYRLRDYENQDIYSYLMLDTLIATGQGQFNEESKIDAVIQTHYVSFLRQIEYDRPTYWLERELAGPMMKTKPPDDFLISDLNWRWPCFRVYLPKGTLTIVRDGQISNIVYLDIMRVLKGEQYTLPPALKLDLWSLGAILNPTIDNAYDGFAVSGVLGLDDPDSSIGYAGTTPLDGVTVKKLIETKGKDLNPGLPSDLADDDLTKRMLKMGLNILLFLSSYPLEYDIDPSKAIIRKPRKEGDRTVPGLLRAKFVGESQLRPKYVGGVAVSSTPHPAPSGYEIGAHWVSGHWKRVWYGPKKGQSRLQWIGLYHTGKEEEAGEMPKDKSV